MNSRNKLAPTQLGGPRSLLVIAGLALLVSATALAEPPLTAPFTRITTGSVWNEFLPSNCAAWGDYDQDGWLDLFIGNRGTRNSLFRNNRDGTFTKVTTGPVATETLDNTHCAAWLDYNNDRLLDLFVIDLSGKGNRLYRNIDGGAFARVTATEVGSFPLDLATSVSISGADYDRDGLLDLFVSNGALGKNEKDFLYHNQGQGRFLRIDDSVVTTPDLSTTQGTWADYDGDGDSDLFVTHSQDHGNSLSRNDGGGQFTDVTQASGLGDFGDSVGSAWGDYDNDGDLDLIVTNLRLTQPANTSNFLYRNEGNGTFTRITEGPIATASGHFQSATWMDYDNDGCLDLFVSVSPYTTGPSVPNRLYRNMGEGVFAQVTTGRLVTDIGAAGGAAWGDYDNDGFLDVAVANGTVFDSQRNGLYRNNGNTNAWIKVRCVGTASNRFAIGAKVRVKATIGGREQTQLRQIAGTEGWLTFNALDVIVGLGDATVIDSILVEWPSGMTSELRNVTPRETLTITEGPALNLARVDNQTVDLTWSAGDHILESTGNLSQPNWQPVLGVTGSSHRITTERQQFFRLHRP